MGDQATNRNASEVVQQRQHGFKHMSADVFEVHVDSLGAGGLQSLGQIRLAMVQAFVKAEFLLDVAALLRATGNADHAAALDPPNLPNHRADGARCRGHDEGFAWLRLPDILQAGVSREARHAEHAQRVGERARRRVDLASSFAARQGIFLPAVAGIEDDLPRLDSRRDSTTRPELRRGPPSPRRSRRAGHTTFPRSCGPACKDRATGKSPAAASGLAGDGDFTLAQFKVVERGLATGREASRI